MSSHPTNREVPDHVGAMLGVAASELAARNSSSRSIASIVEPKALTTRSLEERKLIHPRDIGPRATPIAFREIRTRLLALGGAMNFVTMVDFGQPALRRQLRRAQSRRRVRVRRRQDRVADRLRHAPSGAAHRVRRRCVATAA